MSKICPTCKSTIDESLTICNFCGCPVETDGVSAQPKTENSAATEQPQTSVPYTEPIQFSQFPMPEKKEIGKTKLIELIFSIAGIFDGVLSIVFGIIIAVLKKGFYVVTESYGGDAYTGIQNAAAYTGENVRILIDCVKTIGSFMFIVAGLLLIIVFTKKLLLELNKEKEEQ